VRHLYACYFNADGRWGRLARVCQSTAREHCPDWTVTVEKIKARQVDRRGEIPFNDNTVKLDRWCEVACALPDGAELLLIDADVMILRPLAPLWDLPFDVALTRRPELSRFPFNAGVVGLRISPAVREFMTQWRDINRRFLADRKLHKPWQRRFGGINQAALGCVLEQDVDATVLDVRRVPCETWNCEDSTWRAFNEDTRIVHVKSMLRSAIFDGVAGVASYRALVARWRSLDRKAMELV
jgi:hypothetical protein